MSVITAAHGRGAPLGDDEAVASSQPTALQALRHVAVLVASAGLTVGALVAISSAVSWWG
jgi:hypothetical protein